MGFKPNLYDPRVVNKIVDGHQMTMTWHIDDLKVSHHNLAKIDEVTKKLVGIYGKIKIKQYSKLEKIIKQENWMKKEVCIPPCYSTALISG